MALTLSYAPGPFECNVTNRNDIRALAGELAALELRMAAQQVAAAADSDDAVVFVVSDDNVQTVIRALDHLRNAEADGAEPGAHRELHEARSGLHARVRCEPLSYRLRSWEFGGDERPFFSFSGPYSVGDRMVTADSGVLRVASVVTEATPAQEGILGVERA